MNRREQTLALALGIVLLIGVCAVAFMKMNKWKKDIERRDHEIALRKVTADELLKQKDYWIARSDWLTKKQPVFVSRKEADNALFDYVTKAAKEAGVTAAPPQQQPLDESNPGLKGAGVMDNASGDLEKILRWLFALQHSPEDFISIKGLTLKPDGTDLEKVNVTDLHIVKWYNGAASPAKPQATEGQ